MGYPFSITSIDRTQLETYLADQPEHAAHEASPEQSVININIDLDGDGYREVVTVDIPDYGYGRIRTAFHERTLAIFNRGRPPKSFGGDIELSQDMSGGGNLTRLFTGDFTRDGREDILFEGMAGVYLLESSVAKKSLTRPYQGSFQPREATPVPDYDRKGIIHMSMDGIEMVSPALVGKDEMRFSFQTDKLRARLPDFFLIGIDVDSDDSTEAVHELLHRDKPLDFARVDQRLSSLRFAVRTDIKTDRLWVQDLYEPIVIDGKIISVAGPRPFSGGDIQFARNRQGRMFVTVSGQDIQAMQQATLMKEGQVLRFSQALTKFAAPFGLTSEAVLVIPNLRYYAHNDQTITFIGDGKVLLLKLPPDHPDHARWAAMKQRLTQAGFAVIGEIEVPENLADDLAYSPLNMMVHINQEGVRRYVIPVNPSVVIKDYLGAALSLVDLHRGKCLEFGPGNCIAGSLGDTRFITLYDLADLPPHIRQTQEALVGAGVAPEQIHLFPYVNSGKGGLHCIVNQDP